MLRAVIHLVALPVVLWVEVTISGFGEKSDLLLVECPADIGLDAVRVDTVDIQSTRTRLGTGRSRFPLWGLVGDRIACHGCLIVGWYCEGQLCRVLFVI